jgi:hypothetical protein
MAGGTPPFVGAFGCCLLFKNFVVYLQFENVNLGGTISTWIGKLSWLQLLQLVNTNVGGTVPSQLALISSLTRM